jgi:hypothetical protein
MKQLCMGRRIPMQTMPTIAAAPAVVVVVLLLLAC